ncbi:MULTISPECIES: PilW family protein [unclassified Thioalkalivibrio]|uniref:PilW family protein n=1 Tax=unclassified Thioalkalivibrio TaxID=2621013 RepID=UPI00036828FD|nr:MULTISPECIES: prepilin-type N-terminal cleavage/methylation domain-containing protein [unclassified Thioalkalivibrio]
MLNRAKNTATHTAWQNKRARGFTLIELMIGILVGTIVIAGVIALYITVIRGSAYVTQEARLTQETRIAMDFMAADIRRAGYSNPNLLQEQVDAPPINRFMESDLDIAIHDSGQCILVSYDPTFGYDPAASTGWPPDDQYVFGYRLANNVLEMLTSEISSTDNCADGTWEALTDPNTTSVNRLEFDSSPSSCIKVSEDGTIEANPACSAMTGAAGDIFVESRRIRIELDATHSRAPETRIRHNETISVRNHRIFPEE